MTKRSTAISRAIEMLDAKIEGLRFAKEALLEQQQGSARTPKALKTPTTATAKAS